MRKINLIQVEEELKKRWSLDYKWGRKQNDVWDRYSNFIYETTAWEEVLKSCEIISAKNSFDKKEFLNYSSNRWYNFWSAMAVENIFSNIKGVKPHTNSRSRLIDFNLLGFNFDHKTSVFPENSGLSIDFAKEHPEEVINWLYKNQSSQQRQHFSNRLFLIVYMREGSHWKLKAEISFLKNVIEKYVATFEAAQLKKLEFEPGKPVYSDIIWAIQ